MDSWKSALLLQGWYQIAHIPYSKVLKGLLLRMARRSMIPGMLSLRCAYMVMFVPCGSPVPSLPVAMWHQPSCARSFVQLNSRSMVEWSAAQEPAATCC